MKLVSIGQSFNGGDLGIVTETGEGETGIDAPSIHEDRTGATLPAVAAFLRTWHGQVFPQGIQQGDPGIEVEMDLFLVEQKIHSHLQGGRIAVSGELVLLGSVHVGGHYPSCTGEAHVTEKFAS